MTKWFRNRKNIRRLTLLSVIIVVFLIAGLIGKAFNPPGNTVHRWLKPPTA